MAGRILTLERSLFGPPTLQVHHDAVPTSLSSRFGPWGPEGKIIEQVLVEDDRFTDGDLIKMGIEGAKVFGVLVNPKAKKANVG